MAWMTSSCFSTPITLGLLNALIIGLMGIYCVLHLLYQCGQLIINEGVCCYNLQRFATYTLMPDSDFRRI